MDQSLARNDVAACRDVSEKLEHVVWPYRLALLLMYPLALYAHAKERLYGIFGKRPRYAVWLVDGVSINSHRMRAGATRWPSLDTCYNFRAGLGPSALHRLIDSWWMNVRNAQAVRNRLIIAKREIRIAIESHAIRHQPVRILSLAAGTAQGVIEVAGEMRTRGIDTEILLIDQDETALRHAEQLAARHGVKIKTVKDNVLMFTRSTDGFRADIVEMMGLLDYLRSSLAIKLLRKIRIYLDLHGTFLCCHIHPNSERYFLKHVVAWDGGMIYRTVDEFEDLLIEGGFLAPRLESEPHGIHTISIANKV